MEEERDLVVFSDDEGNEFELEVVDYFEHEGQEYAVLVDPGSYDEEGDAEDEENAAEVYIMKVIVNGEYEEFLPADEDKMEALSAIVEEMFDEWESGDGDGDGCSCGCGCGEDDCEHEHDHGCDCGCGCDK